MSRGRQRSQHGTAPSGYYPLGYSGDIWTGEVVSTDTATREITMTYTNAKKSESFTGVLMENCQVRMPDGSMQHLENRPGGDTLDRVETGMMTER